MDIISKVGRNFISRQRKAGGTSFKLEFVSNYRQKVERMMPRWFKSSGEYSGEYVSKSVKWKDPQVEPHMMAVSCYFTFSHIVDGVKYDEEGKITARFYGNDVGISVLLYS